MEQKPRSFAEFWPHYVGEHRRPLCRALHYAGGIASSVVLVSGIVTRSPILLLLTPVVGYGLAWIAHICVEHNHPATWRYVWWSIRGEFKMLGLGLTGRMGREVERLYGCNNPDPDAPLLKD